MNVSQTDGLDWLTTAEAGALLAISRERVHQLIKKGRLSARREGRYWFVQRDELTARLADRLASEPPPQGFLYRTTLPATGETVLADARRFSGLRKFYHHAQLEAVHVLQPGDRLEFPLDDCGPAWTVECLPARPEGAPFRWSRLPGSRELTLDRFEDPNDQAANNAAT